MMPLIALIDDRQTNRTIFVRLIASLGKQVEILSFANPQTALDALRFRVPDLVITDYNMPEMNGAEFTRRFRLLPKCIDVPVIVITGHGQRDWKLAALQAGATDFLSSPVDQTEFIIRASNLLDLRHHQLQLEKRADDLAGALAATRETQSQTLRESGRRLGQVIDSLPVMISAIDRDGQVLFSNTFRTGFFGRIDDMPHSQTGAGAREPLNAFDRTVLATGLPLPPFEEELQDASGNSRIFLTQKSPFRDSDGQIIGVLSSGFDITERKQAEAHLRHMAHYNLRTDLPNQAFLMRQIRKTIMRARREDRHFAVHVIRLQGFSEVNHLLGHRIDDHFLRAAAENLSIIMREADLLAQIDNDTLAILQAQVSCVDDTHQLAHRIQAIIRHCSTIVDDKVATSASIGIALFPNHARTPEDLLAMAEAAMQAALPAQSIVFACQKTPDVIVGNFARAGC